MKQFRWLTALVVGAFLFGAGAAFASTPNSIEWNGQGSDSLRCEKLGEGDFRTADGWMHWILTGASNVTKAELTLGGSGEGTYDPTKYGSVVEFFTPFFPVDGLTATIFYAGSLARNSQFVLSDYCDPDFLVFEALVVTKTAEGLYDRTVEWELEKSVSPEGPFSGEAGDEFPVVWTVEAEKTETLDNYRVVGDITISNPKAPALVTFEVSDEIQGGFKADVTCPTYTVGLGETVKCTYEASVPGILDPATLNIAVVTVTKVVWDSPYFGTVVGDEASAPVGKFKENLKGFDEGVLSDPRFKFEQKISASTTEKFPETFVCSTDASMYTDGAYTIFAENVAFLNGNLKLEADAAITINCTWPATDETAYADGGGQCFSGSDTAGQWGWINEITPGSYTWPLWAGAAQCNTLKGTEVGWVTVLYADDGYVSVTFHYFAGFSEVETHVYADTVFPTGPYAPGRFTNESPFVGSPVVYVIAHAVVRGVFPE